MDRDFDLKSQNILNRAFNHETNKIGVEADINMSNEGIATSAKQDSQIASSTQLEALIETLQELAQRLAPLGGAMANTAQIRAVVTGAVTASGGGYITSAQEVAALLTMTNSLRATPDNTLAIQSNINNCIGA